MTPRKKKGYKVVARYDSEYRSAYGPGEARSVIYRVGAPTRPKEGCGPLAVFGHKREARRFLKSLDNFWINFRIFHCLYTSSTETTLWSREGPILCRLPPSTRFADEVTLLEAVEDR